MTSSAIPRAADRRGAPRYWLADPFDVRLRVAGQIRAATVINVSASGACLRVPAGVPAGATAWLELGADPVPVRLVWSLPGARPRHGDLCGFACAGIGIDLVERLAAAGPALEDPYGAGGELGG